jgi:hypothetical protein
VHAVSRYTGRVSVRGSLDRSRRRIAVSVDDKSCFADESDDSRERFAGIEVRRERLAWVLVAHFRVNPNWPEFSTCVGHDGFPEPIRTTVTLPAPVGRRAIVDGAPSVSDFRFVLVPPVGSRAIRTLVPRYAYGYPLCARRAVRSAFRGRPKSEWCFF